MFNNIPTELKAYNQFVCWKLEEREGTKPTKIPYCPHTGYMADVTDPKTWSSFDTAIKAYKVGGYTGIGFVFTENDPFCGIDLDKPDPKLIPENQHAEIYEKQLRIYQHFDSYSERSPSGTGLHIIVKGKLPNGRRYNCVEIYDKSRYFTMTGDVFNDKPIEERQNLLTILHSEMGKNPAIIQYDGNGEEVYTDQEIVNMAFEAANGQKFTELVTDWKSHYHSQSEADFAFIDIIAFYTQNKEQIRRIFLSSPLGQRPKAKRPDYFGYMINRAFDRLLPPINLDAIKIEVDDMVEKAKVPKLKDEKRVAKDPEPISDITLPPGLMGDIAKYVYSSSYRPVPEIALATAITLMAGICGRQYNISRQGLNLYILMVAKTGRGKEAIANKSSELMGYITQALPAAKDFIGPGSFGSGQGMIKHLSDSPIKSMFSVVGEFGLTLQQISNPLANSSMSALKQNLLDLFHKSGKHSAFRQVVYSDKAKNTTTIESPAFTICGESTPTTLYDNMQEHDIVNGLMPRFLTIEYLGDRVDPNDNHVNVFPDGDMLTHLKTLVNKVLMLGNAGVVVDVNYSSEADKLQRKFDRFCTKKINDKNVSEAVAELWNRSHIKAIRLAALIAVGNNENDPVIDEQAMQWAIDFVKRDTERVVWRFDKGKIGKNLESDQSNCMMRIIKEYVVKTYDDCAAKYAQGTQAKKLHENKVVTFAYLQRRLVSQAAFKNDKLGATSAIKKMVQSLIDTGAIYEVPKQQLLKQFNTTARCFAIIDGALLDE